VHRVALYRIRRRGWRNDINPLFTALNRFCQKLCENAAVPFEFQRAGARERARNAFRLPPAIGGEFLPRARRYGRNFARGVGALAARQGEGKKSVASDDNHRRRDGEKRADIEISFSERRTRPQLREDATVSKYDRDE